MAVACGITHLHAKHSFEITAAKKYWFPMKRFVEISCYKNIFFCIVFANCGCALSSWHWIYMCTLTQRVFHSDEKCRIYRTMKLSHGWKPKSLNILLLGYFWTAKLKSQPIKLLCEIVWHIGWMWVQIFARFSWA